MNKKAELTTEDVMKRLDELQKQGIVPDTADVLKAVTSGTISQTSSQLLNAISVLDEMTAAKLEYVMIRARLSRTEALISGIDEQIKAASRPIHVVMLQHVKNTQLQIRATDLSEMNDLVAKNDWTNWQRSGKLVDELFPNSKKALELAEKHTGAALSAGVLAWEIKNVLENPDINHLEAVEKISENVIVTTASAAADYSSTVRNFVAHAGGVGANGAISSRAFLSTVARASVASIGSGVAVGLVYTVFNRGAYYAFNAVGLYENETYISSSDQFFGWFEPLLGLNELNETAAIAHTVSLFNLLDPKFDDQKLRAIMGESDNNRLMSYEKAKAAYTHVCVTLGVKPGDTSTPDAFALSVLKNQGVFLKEMGLAGKLTLQAYPSLRPQEVAAIAMQDNERGLAIRYAMLHGSPMLVTGEGIDYAILVGGEGKGGDVIAKMTLLRVSTQPQPSHKNCHSARSAEFDTPPPQPSPAGGGSFRAFASRSILSFCAESRIIHTKTRCVNTRLR